MTTTISHRYQIDGAPAFVASWVEGRSFRLETTPGAWLVGLFRARPDLSQAGPFARFANRRPTRWYAVVSGVVHGMDEPLQLEQLRGEPRSSLELIRAQSGNDFLLWETDYAGGGEFVVGAHGRLELESSLRLYAPASVVRKLLPLSRWTSDALAEESDDEGYQ